MNFNIIQNNTPLLSHYNSDGNPELSPATYLFYYLVGTDDGGIEIRCGYKFFREWYPGITPGDYRTGLLMNNGNSPAPDGSGSADFWGLVYNYVLKPSSVLFPVEYIEERAPNSNYYSVISTIPLATQLEHTAGYYISVSQITEWYHQIHNEYPTLTPNLSGTSDPSFYFSHTQWRGFLPDWLTIPRKGEEFAGGTTHCCLLYLCSNQVTREEAAPIDKVIKTVRTANLNNYNQIYSDYFTHI